MQCKTGERKERRESRERERSSSSSPGELLRLGAMTPHGGNSLNSFICPGSFLRLSRSTFPHSLSTRGRIPQILKGMGIAILLADRAATSTAATASGPRPASGFHSSCHSLNFLPFFLPSPGLGHPSSSISLSTFIHLPRNNDSCNVYFDTFFLAFRYNNST